MKNKILLIGFYCLQIAISSHAQTATISGQLTTFLGDAIPNATVLLTSSNVADTTVTDEQGNYNFVNLETGPTYTIELSKESDPLNGVSTFDLVLMQRAIIQDEQQILFSRIAADVDQSGRVSVRDMFLLRQLMLGLATTPDIARWEFYPADFEISEDLGKVPSSREINLTTSVEGVNFIGYKLGDVSGNASVN